MIENWSIVCNNREWTRTRVIISQYYLQISLSKYLIIIIYFPPLLLLNANAQYIMQYALMVIYYRAKKWWFSSFDFYFERSLNSLLGKLIWSEIRANQCISIKIENASYNMKWIHLQKLFKLLRFLIYSSEYCSKYLLNNLIITQ